MVLKSKYHIMVLKGSHNKNLLQKYNLNLSVTYNKQCR